ncbi:MAG: DUF3794 domain-containing protein [Eubacteriales bacterium]|nr:DUF3794 domain-containing protein [Eubacteriales bacterium]
MELLKKNIHMMREKGRSVNRVTLEEDSNVPDQQPDVERIIQNKAVVHTDDIQVEPDTVIISGSLQICVLYVSDTPEHQIHRLDAKIPFRERQNLQGVVPGETVHLKWEVEDISVSPINSRKLSMKALLAFTASVEEVYDAQAAVELHGVPEASTLAKDLELLQLAVQKKDILRIKDEVAVSSNKPNIANVLWESIQLRGTDYRVLDGQIDIKGELFVFVLYEGDDENRTRQWLETALPFQGVIECKECSSDMVSQIDIVLSQSSLEVLEDYDGERRLLALEALLDLDIKLYTEEKVRVLEDIYSPVKNLVPVTEQQVYESLLVKNFSKVRSGERIRLEANQPRMLQTCSSRGEVRIDSMAQTEKGIEVEGAVFITVLYVSSDDKTPYAVLEGAVPFQQTIEVNGITKDCRFTMQTDLEQLSTTMIDSEEIEAKVCVNLNVFVIQVHREQCIVDIEEKEMDMKKLQELPGIVGYIVQPGDTLWEISKHYCTTPERICALNQIEEGNVKSGMRLMIIKTVSS